MGADTDKQAGKGCQSDAVFSRLIAIMKTYHPSGVFEEVEAAYTMAASAHAGQMRKSGEPYVIHPLEVACILADLGMDKETIMAGILHDVIEDVQGYTVVTMKDAFSEEVARLVDGVTKLTNTEYASKDDEQADNYRKLFLAISTDIRVIIIKIADRLHNLRTLDYMPPEKRVAKAQETLDIYAPLAHRLGISKIRVEMEDLSFKYSMPEKFGELSAAVTRMQQEREGFIRLIGDETREKLEAAGIAAVVDGRPKHFFSIYKKMQAKKKTLDEIYDVFALRIIVDDAPDCYSALGVMHGAYGVMPGRMKDYIAMPKQNGYRSLHTTLLKDGQPFEVQIRTREMHRQSEYGVAAHWKYKEGYDDISAADSTGDAKTDDARSEEKLNWLRRLLEWQRDMSDSKEYLESLRFDLNVYQAHVYIFTPKGQVISLNAGATPIDYAYAIHSAIGNKMVGAKVNGKLVPIDTQLNTGDRVEILTSQNSKGPSMDWLKFCKTSQAKTKINQWFKQENKQVSIIRGKDALEKAAKAKGATLPELLRPEYLKVVLNRYALVDWDAVCAAVGHGSVREGNIINRLYDEYAKDKKEAELAETAKRLLESAHETKALEGAGEAVKGGVMIKNYGVLEARFPKCCGPMPGDEIIAYVTRGRGITVHRTDCQNIIHLPDIEKERLREADWITTSGASEGTFAVDVSIVCDHAVKSPTEIMKVLEREGAELRGLSRMAKRDEVFVCAMTVSSKEMFEKVSKKLLAIAYIQEINRVIS